MVKDVKTGKEYDPQKEFDKLFKDPEFLAMLVRMQKEQGRGWPVR